MELFFTAFRNIFRNKRRSVINIIAISIGVILMLIYIGWMRGYFTSLFATMINFETGHIQILNENYLNDEERMPLDINIENYRNLRTELLSDPRIDEVTARIDFTLSLSNGTESKFIMGRAIEPDREADTTVLKDYINTGNYLDKEPGIMVGKPLAERLSLSPGDYAYVTVFDRYSSRNFDQLKITGIFNFGYPVMDENLIFMDIDTADSLLDLDGEITKLVLRLDKYEDINPVLTSLNDTFKESNSHLKAYTWQRFAQVVVSAVQQDGVSFAIIMIICFILIILGILNSMHMSVHERIREIGTLRAIGMKKKQLFSMFISESICLALVSVVIGLALGGLAAYYLQYVGFELSEVIPKDIPIPFGDRFTADFRWYDFFITGAIGVVTAVLGGILPVRAASKVDIARALTSMQAN
jgi:ABC-type lipoprotein release transport system permease subunit